MQLTLIDPSVLQLVCSSRPSPSLSPTRSRPRLKSTSRSSGLASGSLRACTGGSLLRSRRYCCWRTRVELIRVYVSSMKLRSPPPYESLGRAQVQRPSTDRGQRSARHPSLSVGSLHAHVLTFPLARVHPHAQPSQMVRLQLPRASCSLSASRSSLERRTGRRARRPSDATQLMTSSRTCSVDWRSFGQSRS